MGFNILTIRRLSQTTVNLRYEFKVARMPLLTGRFLTGHLETNSTKYIADPVRNSGWAHFKLNDKVIRLQAAVCFWCSVPKSQPLSIGAL